MFTKRVEEAFQKIMLIAHVHRSEHAHFAYV